MSQSGYTPIQLYRTTTAAATPTAGNLAAGELAINLTDEKLYFKNAGGTVKLLASSAGAEGTVTSVAASGGTTGLTFSGSPITSSGTLTLGGTLAVANGGTGVTTSTGTGSVVLSTSPTLTTPNLGTPSAATLTNATGLPLTTGVTGTLGVANGGTGTATQFTAGSVVFAGASGVYSQSNANLFWDNGNARLGIGTSSPAERLDVNGTIKGGVAAGVTLLMADSSAIRNTASAGNTMYFDSGVGAGSTTGDFQFRSTASYTTRFYINGNTGNVGIGTTGPISPLDVAGAIRSGSGGTDPGTGAAMYFVGSGSFQTVVAGAAFAVNTGSNNARTERMRIDNSGNVGIGTSSPAVPLEVAGNIRSLGLFQRFDNSGLTLSGGTTFNTGGASIALRGVSAGFNTYGMEFYAGGSERVRIDTSGNVGIGTTASWAKLQVSNAGAEQLEFTPAVAANVNRILSYNRNANAYNTMRLDGADYQFYVSGSERVRIDSSGNVLIGTSSSPSVSRLYVDSTEARIQSRNSTSGANGYIGAMNPNEWRGAWAITGTPVTFGTSDVERMRLDSSGNVGIGTSAPNARLSLGFLVSNKVFALYDDGTNQYGMGIAGSQYRLFAATGANICFGNYARGTDTFTETVRIDSSGNLLVGTTTPSGMLTVTAPASTTAAYLQNQTTATWTTRIVNTGATGDNYLVLFETDTNSQRGSVTYNRTAGLIQYNTTSDYRAKTIHGPVEDVGSTVDALKVYNGTMHGATQSRPMLVAHEAQEVAPYAVFGEKDAVNPDGTPAYQSIDVSALVPLLIAEIQSLRARVAQLEGN